jgi:hypothetical protein
MSSGLVHGVGRYNKGKFTTKKNNIVTKEYDVWKNMLRRCYCSKEQEKCPTYKGCYVSDNFKDFQFFAKWCHSQIGFGEKGYQLDKDILIRSNKLYSENTCVFVPSRVNSILLERNADRGEWPIGVYLHKKTGRFAAQVGRGRGKREYLGVFSTPDEAFLCYKNAKEAIIKQLAEEYRDKVDTRVYNALLEYKVT